MKKRYHRHPAVGCIAAVLVYSTMFTVVPGKESTGEAMEKTHSLPAPRHTGQVSVEQALNERRSVRSFRSEPLTLEALSQLLWAAQGITDARGYRTAPSAGALYPLEVYVVAGKVTGLSPGVYAYEPRGHRLRLVRAGDRRRELSSAALGQSCVESGAVALVFSAVYERVTGKYGARGERYAHIEAGHAAQNVCLQAVSLDLGTVVVGAFRDGAVKKVIGMKDKEAPLYIMPVGVK